MNAKTTILSRYTIGPDAYEMIPDWVANFGSRVLIAGGEKALQAAKQKLLPILTESGLEIAEVALYGGECTFANIAKLAEKIEKSGADALIAVGGGKCCDTCKGAADAAGVPVFTCPTIASNCAPASALSVVYDDAGAYADNLYYPAPPEHCFIDTDILAHAPAKYLRAGLGDTLAKTFEVEFTSRGVAFPHSSSLARTISAACWPQVRDNGLAALREAEAGTPGKALEEAALAIIITTGLVSMLINDDYNASLAHALFYGLTTLPGVEEAYLHGDVVAYGVLVLLTMDKQEKARDEVCEFLRSIGIMTSLREMGISASRESLEGALAAAMQNRDFQNTPYPVDAERFFRAILETEAYTKTGKEKRTNVG